MNIDHYEGTLITIGIAGISTMAYWFYNSKKKSEHYQKQLDDFKSKYDEFNINHKLKKQFHDLNFKKGEKRLICINHITPEYNPYTFTLYERQRSKFLKEAFEESLLEHQMGGDFTFQYKNQKIKCRLDDVILSTQILKSQFKDVHIFKGINDLQPLVAQVTTTLNPKYLIGLYGILFFDQGKTTWTIQPKFMTWNQQLRSFVQNYYRSKTQYKKMALVAAAIGIAVLGYFTIFKPIKSLFKKAKQLVKAVNKDDLQYFRQKDFLIIKGASLLNCQVCKKKNVQMIYECGHIAICEQCHQKSQKKVCPLCKKGSKRFLKIFIA